MTLLEKEELTKDELLLMNQLCRTIQTQAMVQEEKNRAQYEKINDERLERFKKDHS